MGSEGECSKKSDGEGGNEAWNDSERPLKKARYVWQVKGKYHLKESYAPPVSCLQPKASNSLQDEELTNNNFENNNVCGDQCIEALLTRSEAMISADYSSDEDNLTNIDKSISDEIPVTLVKPNPKNQDYYLMKWQARQVAKGYLDNTINRVLETCMIAPSDAADIVENCENGVHVEDEGILMAIQSHGLQSGQKWGESSSNDSSDQTNAISFMRPQGLAESALDNYQNIHNELLKHASSAETSSNVVDFVTSDHSNFLDAAVSVAIQKKGLTSQNMT